MKSLQSYKSKKSIKSEANIELRLEGHEAIIKAHRKGARSVRADHPLTVQNDNAPSQDSKSDESNTD
jgi:hypothetical protein